MQSNDGRPEAEWISLVYNKHDGIARDIHHPRKPLSPRAQVADESGL